MLRVEGVSDAWEDNAGEWLAWARTADHDVWHWHFNFPQFVDLLPPAKERTLDVGCGEGRVGRWLAGHGHRVFGIDSSSTLTAAAAQSGGYQELVCGDAAALRWPCDTFDLAVAYMVLQDMPDPDAVVCEIGRVLRPGGRLALAITHPLNRSVENLDRYFERLRFRDEVVRDGLKMTFDGVDRPLSDYTEALARHGFGIERLTEPRPSAEACRTHSSLAKAADRPYFVHMRCRLSV